VSGLFRRREFIAIIGGMATWPLALRAQQIERMKRIGVLLPGGEGDSLSRNRIAALRAGLEERGWSEGRNVALEIRYLGGRPERAAGLVAELVLANVDVIVTAGTELIQAARNASRKLPVVMAGAGDPVGAKLVMSLARPGGHVTGLSLIAPELAAKRLEIAKEVIPDLARVAIIWNPNNASVVLRFRETLAAAQMLGIALESIEVRQPADFENGLQRAAHQGAAALITTEDTLLLGNRASIVRLAMRHRLPTISGLRQFADIGGFLSYGPSSLDLWRRATGYVDKILNGADPADLPVEQPTRFELVINLKTAKALGLTVPPTLLARADEVIE
jgi:putative ABC transport system substrate-binding protein